MLGYPVYQIGAETVALTDAWLARAPARVTAALGPPSPLTPALFPLSCPGPLRPPRAPFVVACGGTAGPPPGTPALLAAAAVPPRPALASPPGAHPLPFALAAAFPLVALSLVPVRHERAFSQ